MSYKVSTETHCFSTIPRVFLYKCKCPYRPNIFLSLQKRLNSFKTESSSSADICCKTLYRLMFSFLLWSHSFYFSMRMSLNMWWSNYFSFIVWMQSVCESILMQKPLEQLSIKSFKRFLSISVCGFKKTNGNVEHLIHQPIVSQYVVVSFYLFQCVDPLRVNRIKSRNKWNC